MKTFDDFLAALLAFESGIDPSLHAWYVANFDVPVLNAAQVTLPGRVVRDQSGRIVFRRMTVCEYFTSLGIIDRFDHRSSECLATMQYRVTNALGFIGYQFGEAILIDIGYYIPEKVTRIVDGATAEYCRYYVGSVHESAWSGGQSEVIHRIPGAAIDIVVTDVNCWRGTFTGRNGFSCIEDLKRPELQSLVIRDTLNFNYARIEGELLRAGDTLEQAILRQTNETPSNPFTMSGVLAAAHLCGALATVKFLRSGVSAADEFGTTLERYLVQFSGYDTPYSNPVGRDDLMWRHE